MGSVNLLNSGLDVNTLVDQLIYVESVPVRSMQQQTTKLQSKVSAFQSVNTKLSSLLDKVNAILFSQGSIPLSTPYSLEDRLQSSIFTALAASSSDEAVLTATGSRGSASGSFSITVSSLARAQTSASGNFDDSTTTTFGTGSISITVGTNDPVSITIDESNNTLDGIRKAINAANAGVTATIINDGTASPYRLLVSANETGTANGFTITPDLSGGALPLSFSQTAEPDDASINVNGIDIIKSSNTISDVIDGVTLHLRSESPLTPVSVSVAPDLDAIVNALKNLASAYNEANSFINSQSRYDQNTKTAGILSGDATLRSTQSRIQSVVTQSVSNSFTDYAVISQVGFQFNNDGTITVNDSSLREALSSDLQSVAALFLGNGTAPTESEPGQEGSSPIVNLRSTLKSITDPLSGPIHNATDSLNSSISSIKDQIETYQDRLDTRRELLMREFSKADQALRLLGVTQSSLSAQVGSLGILG